MKYVCIHGHFYQPPRENAWLEKVELQDSAHPFHDWNERITYECYAPNTASRILDNKDVIKNIVNNYSTISFNFGPTLLSWMREMDSETYQAIIEADHMSMERFNGHGSAIAQVYNHMIMPLASRKDQETQVIWGIRDFEHRFSRFPEGMWLGETAVSTETLEVLAENNIKYTILAPRQAKSVRAIGAKDWVDVTGERVDPRRAYLCNLPSGKSINVFFYDGSVSKDVAFNNLLSNGKVLAERVLETLDKSPKEPQLAHIATDGESYGHHHRHGDMALAYCIDHITHNSDATAVNYGLFLEKAPPNYEVEIIENSSWSCVHGVERWRSNCGCHTGGDESWNQKWRQPLREALDYIRDEMVEIFEAGSKDLLNDPWAARNDYVDVIIRRKKKTLDQFLKSQAKPSYSKGNNTTTILRLLEMQRHAMLMYTSCGWFFNDISGIETKQVLQYAARAIQLAEQVGDKDLTPTFIKILSQAKSNIPEQKDARVIYEDLIKTTLLDLKRVGMHYGVASIFEKNIKNLSVFNYWTKADFFERRDAGLQKIVFGRVDIISKTTYSEKQFSFVAVYLGQHNIVGYISTDMTDDVFKGMYRKTLDSFRESNLGKMISIMQYFFKEDRFSIWHLFKDEKRRIFNDIVRGYLLKLELELRQIYEQDYQLVNALLNEDIPVPSIYKHTFEFVLNAELEDCLSQENIDFQQLNSIVYKFRKWNLKLDPNIPYTKLVNDLIQKNLKLLSNGLDDGTILENLNLGFDLLRNTDMKPSLYKSQNLYFYVAKNIDIQSWSEEKRLQFRLLGENLGVKV